jgi:tuftelin-interacting protein 11
MQVKAKVVEPRLWKKNKAAERVRREYRTADEILSDQSGKPASIGQPILDMRGPQAKLITDMEALNTVTEEADGQNIPMPELQHNLRLLVDLAAADIQRIDGKLRHSKV